MVLLSMDAEAWFEDGFEDVLEGGPDGWADGWADGQADRWPGPVDAAGWDPSLAAVLAESLDDSYADATEHELAGALDSMLEEMSAAEAFGFAKALGQIQRGAARAVSDPTFAQIAGAVAPAAGGALGTVIGGPLGTAVGSQLGSAAAKALARPGSAGAGPGSVRQPAGPVAGGSTAAARGLVLTQQPDVLKALLGLALGQHGQQSVSGMPVASIMGMLSSVFGQAAEDADELMYLRDARDAGEADWDGEVGDAEWAAATADGDASIYTSLVDADNAELAESWESS